MNTARQLQQAGHEVTVVAGTRGFGKGEVPPQLRGLNSVLFSSKSVVPGVGFAGVASPGMLLWLRKHARDFDVAHVHFARDLTVLPAALVLAKAGVPLVLQTHGMIDPSGRSSARLLDLLATKRILRGAGRVLYLTEQERRDLLAVGGATIRLSRLVNGVPGADAKPTRTTGPRKTALFMARLHPRKRPDAFLAAALSLTEEFPDWHFVLSGPDEGMGNLLAATHERAGSPARVHLTGATPVSDVGQRMSGSDLYVLPSVNEPFPVSVLEAMANGLPVVVTTSCGLAPFVEEAQAGIVVDDASQADLRAAMRSLMTDERRRRAFGDNARKLVGDEFSIAAVVQQLEVHYGEVL
jgi:glycosyltransferase involved in cell wall biosynthesis